LPLLELRAIAKSFGQLKVINNLSLSLKAGEALGVLGPNGAGKTTMFNLISGDSPLSSGTILLKGKDIGKLPSFRRCHLGIGRTYQIPRPFGGLTVFENVLVGATYGRQRSMRESHRLCYDVLLQTGLLDSANKAAGQLRLLDRKRLELARALAIKPELLLLDEIAGGLTEHEVHELLAVIAAIRATGVTIIWVEHVLHALVSSVDRILVINAGEKLIEGAPQEVLASNEVQEIYLGVEEV
jgi:branched-chain amino acid transport system ATP-binding protein